jgi:hypothetical protein
MAELPNSGSILTTEGWVPKLGVSLNKNITLGKGLEIKADESFDEETKVSMAVGKDGHLWLKIGDSWKRVVTE